MLTLHVAVAMYIPIRILVSESDHIEGNPDIATIRNQAYLSSKLDNLRQFNKYFSNWCLDVHPSNQSYNMCYCSITVFLSTYFSNSLVYIIPFQINTKNTRAGHTNLNVTSSLRTQIRRALTILKGGHWFYVQVIIMAHFGIYYLILNTNRYLFCNWLAYYMYLAFVRKI